MKVAEMSAKSIFVPSRLPDADVAANPYIGCAFGCVYCYASFMGRLVGEGREAWGGYVYVKTNAVELAASELVRWPEHRRRQAILLSSVTDPYQGVERRYRLSRGILTELAKIGYPGLVSVLTKSPLVLRDVDVLRELRWAEVGFTVTTTDDQLSRSIELKAPISSRRLDALEQLSAAGISTYAFVGPLLPHFRFQPQLLERLMQRLGSVGVGSVYVEHINLSAGIRRRYEGHLARLPDAMRQAHADAASGYARDELDVIVAELATRYGLAVRHSVALRHGLPPSSRGGQDRSRK
jgi:DNA repair photolyase